jgi:hypothetical protein
LTDPEHATTTAVRRVAQHVDAEHRNHVPEIMATISKWDVQYALLSAPAGGPDLMLATSQNEARSYYELDRTNWIHVRSDHLFEMATPRFVFHDSVGYLAPLDGSAAIRPRAAVLFPVWPDGIIGEIAWLRPDWSPSPDDAQSAQVAVGQLHDQFVDCWSSGDVEGALELFDPDVCTVSRTAALDGDRRTLSVCRSVDQLRANWTSADAGRIQRLERVQLAVTEWYAFAVYRILMTLPGGPVERDMAAVYPVGRTGRLSGQLSYAFDRRADAI